ncbi:MAG: MaoC family dehydratase [Mesorhizobium sp.]|nr:MaoC family dehydratase [Mesorhizobium sp.]MCO5162441.1 MaoC family dehydratase [Mesorhizobium sp.]
MSSEAAVLHGQKEAITIEAMSRLVGQEVGVSPWRQIDQQMIDRFADATDDHQFIHVDPERARAETPYGGTIAHGFLLLSLFSPMAYETLPPLKGAGMAINHGFDRIRFTSPVRSGARVRTRFLLAELNARPSGMVQIGYDVTMEIENAMKPALTARWQMIAVMERRDEPA